jgi:hypothetical protein
MSEHTDRSGRPEKRPGARTPRDPEGLVDESSEESFPASDPPSWVPIHTGPPVRTPLNGHERVA